MESILRFIVAHCMCLFRDHGFRITDSDYASGKVAIESDAVSIWICMESGFMCLGFFSKLGQQDDAGCVPLSTIREFLTGEQMESEYIDTGYETFLESNWPRVLSLFAAEQYKTTLPRLRALGKARNDRVYAVKYRRATSAWDTPRDRSEE